MIYLFKGRQRCGKTTVMVGAAHDLILHGGYSCTDIYANLHLFEPAPAELNEEQAAAYLALPSPMLKWWCKHQNVVPLHDYHYCTTEQIKVLVKAVVELGVRHKILVIDEIDRIFSHLYWQQKAQVEALIGLWQDEKLDLQILGTAHIGAAVNKLIRESMQFEVIPEKGIKKNTLNLTILNALDQSIDDGWIMENIGLIQRTFCTYEPIVVGNGGNDKKAVNENE